MTLDPYGFVCPYCAEGKACPKSVTPDEYTDEGAYVYTTWTCDKCGKSGWLTMRMAYVYASIEDDEGQLVREEVWERCRLPV